MNKGYMECYGNVIHTLSTYIKEGGGWKKEAEAFKTKLQAANHTRQHQPNNLQELRKDTETFCQTLELSLESLSNRIFGTWVTNGSQLKQELKKIIHAMDESLKPPHRKNPASTSQKIRTKDDDLSQQMQAMKVKDESHNDVATTPNALFAFEATPSASDQDFEKLEQMLNKLQENESMHSSNDNVPAFLLTETPTPTGTYYNKKNEKYAEFEQALHQRRSKKKK